MLARFQLTPTAALDELQQRDRRRRRTAPSVTEQSSRPPPRHCSFRTKAAARAPAPMHTARAIPIVRHGWRAHRTGDRRVAQAIVRACRGDASKRSRGWQHPGRSRLERSRPTQPRAVSGLGSRPGGLLLRWPVLAETRLAPDARDWRNPGKLGPSDGVGVFPQLSAKQGTAAYALLSRESRAVGMIPPPATGAGCATGDERVRRLRPARACFGVHALLRPDAGRGSIAGQRPGLGR